MSSGRMPTAAGSGRKIAGAVRNSLEPVSVGKDGLSQRILKAFPRPVGTILLAISIAAGGACPANGYQLDFERAPVSYSVSTPTDPVTQLAAGIASGKTELTFDQSHGYLRSLLQALDISPQSQTLVFSKTSLQTSRISPSRPRAVYFNDDVYVGWVRNGDVIELSAADDRLGGTFYVLRQDETEKPRLIRETSRCLQCHGSTHTRRIPGHMVRSVYPEETGMPAYRLGTHRSQDSTEWRYRWGGWYVTGTHGAMRHMGNVCVTGGGEATDVDREAGANRTDLEGLVDTAPYLTPHSDIVALLVLQHQTQMHNILTAAHHAALRTAHDLQVMNEALDRPADFLSESAQRRYDSAAEKVVSGLLFRGEQPFTDTVRGTSLFREEFESRGPWTNRGQSLRDFDLKTRLFKHRCSFLIYSTAFASLPDPLRLRVSDRLKSVLGGDENDPEYSYLTAGERAEILSILIETGILPKNSPGESTSE